MNAVRRLNVAVVLHDGNSSYGVHCKNWPTTFSVVPSNIELKVPSTVQFILGSHDPFVRMALQKELTATEELAIRVECGSMDLWCRKAIRQDGRAIGRARERDRNSRNPLTCSGGWANLENGKVDRRLLRSKADNGNLVCRGPVAWDSKYIETVVRVPRLSSIQNVMRRDQIAIGYNTPRSPCKCQHELRQWWFLIAL